MESTDSYSTPKSNDPYEEVQDDTNQAGDDDLCPEWPDGGMVCPVTGCGTKFYVNLTTYWGHWKSKHHEQLRQLYCPECPHKSVNKKYFATHLTKKHRIKMSDLDQVIASVHTELIPNKEFIPPGTQRCPKRKSVSSESQMGPKKQRMKSPSQDSQCKQDEDNSSVTDAETDVKVSICNVAKDVSSADEIERLPITQLSETGQKEGSDKNGSNANETSRNDISHSHQSKKVTVCPPTGAQNISVSDAESERGISDSSSIIEMDKEKSDSSSIIEMDKEKSEAAQFPDRGWHEGGMRCHVPACGSQHFDTLNSYQAHWKQVHCDTIKEFKCPLCSFKQSEKLQLQRHLRLKHKVDKTALQAMLSIVKAKVLPNQQYIDPGTVQCPKGEVYDLSGSVGKTKRPRLSAAQGSEMKQTTCGEKPSTQQTDFSDPAVGGKSLSAHSIRSDNKQHADDFGFQDKRILQDGLKVDTAAAISNEDNVSVDTVKQVVAVLEREETEINESVSKIKKSAVEMKRKVADVDKVTVESEKAIDTQVLECVSKVTETESAVEMKRKVADVDKGSVESEKAIDTQVLEYVTKVTETESAVEMKRKVADVDKGNVESEKAIDTQVLECVTKVTETESAVEMERKVADVDKVTIESEKAIDTQVLECVTKVTETESAVEMKRKVADVDQVTVESEKAIDTQVLECVTEAESAVEMKRKVADVDQVTVESEKAIDTQVLECVTEAESAVEMKRKVADVDKVTVESEKAIDTQVLECVTKVTETESAVEMKRKVADVDKVTVESEKAIDTQVLECVSKVTETESAVEMERKVADVDKGSVESEKAIDTQVLECVTKVTETESAVEMKRKVADVDKGNVESEKAIDTQVLECVTKVTETESAVEMKRKVADVDKVTIESEKAIDTQVLECITKVTETESAVEMERKVADVDKVTIESEKAIDTQVLECVTKVTETESAVEMKRKVADVDKVTVESEKAIDTQVLECVTKVTETESAVEMKRKVDDVDKVTVESEKAIDTQVLECVTKVTETESAVEMKRKVADVDKVTVESEKAIDTQVLECVTKVTETESAVEMMRKVADVDKGNVESEKAIDTQVLECVTKVTETESAVEMKRKGTLESEKTSDTQVSESFTNVTESAVEMKRKVADVDKGSVEKDKAIDTQVSLCVHTSDIKMKRAVDSEMSLKVSEAARKIETKTDSASNIHDIPSDRIRKENDKSITEIPESFCIRIRKSDDEEKINPPVETETVNDKERHGIYISYDTVIGKGDDKSEYDDDDKSGYNDEDKSGYNNEDQSGYHESDRDLTMTDDSELDEAKEAEDLDTVVRPIFLDGQMLCPGSGCLDQVYDSLKAFYKHWQAEHQLSVQRFECPSCSFKDVRKMEIRRHLKKDHNVRQRYVLEELMSLIKLESTPKTAEDSKPETSSKRKSTCQLKAKIKKQKMSFESDADEREDGKEKKVSSSKKREGVVSMPDWVESGMPCPVRECGDHHYTSHGSFISHWKKKHTNLSVKFECPDCSIQHFDKMNLKRHLQYRHHYQGEKLEVKMTKIKSTIVDNGGFSDTRVQKGAKVKDVLLKEKSYKREKLRDKDKTEKDTKDEGPKVEDSIKVEIQVSGESNEKLSPKKEKVVWFFGMTCPVKNCGPRNFVSPREFHNHWENVHHPYIKKFECPICQYKNTQREVVGNHLRLSHNAVKTNDVRDLSQIKMVDVSNPMFKDPGRFYFRDVSSMPSRNPDVKTAATTSPVQGTDGIHELKEAEDTITQASEKISKDPIPVKWVSGMSCPVMNCGASYFMTILSFRSHWENIHNINILKFKCPLCTFTNITKANIIAHLSVQHKMSDAMVKAKVNQIQNVKVKNNRYIDPGFYCFSEMEEVKQFQTDMINTSLSEKKEMDLGADLKGKIEKAGKISWMVGMCCPVKACGSETYLTLDSFSNHWIKTHHLELNMFQCSQCTFKAIQKSEIENHLKSHHWILAEKDVETALSKLQVVKVLNPAFKDTEGYQFGPPGTEEGECSLSNSENKPSEQASKEMDLGADLKGKIEKAGKITWMIGMCCPVKACGSETYLTLDSFSNHWIKTHHLELNMFQCSQCTFRAIQKSEIENHLKSHHWILAEKDVKTALTKVQVVNVLNPAFKDTEGYQFGPPGTEEEGECSLSNSENKPEQASKVTTSDTIDALVESTIKSPSENEELGLISSSSKSAAEEKEPVKVVFVSNMSCPVDKCGTHTFASLSAFEDHWTKRHLPVRDHFKCKICKIGNIVRMSTYRHIKDVHGIKYFAIEKYIYTVSDTNSQFLDPGPFYFEKCSELAEIAKNTIAAKSASGIQKKEKTKCKSTSQKERQKIAVEWKYNMTCPVCKCDLKIYDSWTSYCQHWEMAHEQRYLQVPACPKCSFQSGQRSHLIHHMKQRHNLVGKELDRAVEEIRFVDVENPSFVDPGNYTCIWFGKCSENEKSSTTASSGNGKTESESRSEEEMPKIVVEWENNLTCPSQNKKFKFTPGMPCPVKNCSPVQISSYSAFVQHWNEHALMLKKFACTLCDFKHIQKSIVFMHVRKEHGMPSHVVTNKITTVMETNVKAEELYVPELPIDHRRSIIMVKPDDSGQLNTCDTNGGKIKEATDVVQELKKSEESGKLDEQKDESKEESEKDESEKEESKGQMHEDAWTGLGDEKKPLESTQLADVNRENVLTNNTAQRVYKSSDEDIKLRMSENQEKKEVSLQKKATELAERKQWYPKKLKFAPGMPCPAKNCRHFHFASYSAFVQHWNEQHARMQTKFACTICDFKHIERPIVFLHVRKEHDMPSHVVKKKITKVKETNVKAEELYVPEMTDHRRSIIMVKPDDSEVSLQKKATEPTEMEERYPKKSKFAPGMPYPVKNCSPVHMQEKFACTICDFKDIHRSIVFMHVRKEHGVPSHVGKKIITKLKETNVKAEELYFPEMPKDRRRSIIMVKPDDSEVSLQKKATESSEGEKRYPKKPKFAPGMPCPVKHCRHFHFASYSAFVQHWNERHARMQTMFACTMCDLKHIERSIVFMHVRKEHGMPFQVIKKKITKVKETNVKAEELYVPEMTDHRRSIIMVKPDDIDQFNTCDTNGGKIKKATDVVEELKKSDENIGTVNEQKEGSKGRRDEKKPLESTQPAAEGVYKSSDEDIKLRMSENQEKKEASVQKKATKPAQKEQRYPKKLKFAPGMPCPVKNCSTSRISSYSLLEHHWNERHGLMLKKFACTICDFKNNQKSIVFMHVRKEHGIPSHVAAAKITMVTESNSQYVDADELYFPEFPAEDRKLIFMIKPDDSETGVFGEVLPDSSAEQPTLIEKDQMEAKQLVSPKDEEDMIEKEEHSVKSKVESSKDQVKTVIPSGSSDVPKSLVDDEDLISDFKDDSLVIDMSQFICIDEIGDEDAEVNEESSEKQSAKETVLPGDQEYEIQDEISSPTKDDKIEDILRNFVCIDDIGDEEGS